MKIGFIGPDTMGAGMAMNLSRCEGDLTVFARREAALQPFAEKGIAVSTDFREASGSDILFLCMPNAGVVRNTLFGEKAPVLSEGALGGDCSTIRYEDALELAADLNARGIRFMDAPVSGHRERAQAGTLTIMCGGAKEDYEEVKPYLDLMGTTVLLMGGVGAGQLAKMINNCALNICTASFCELMPLGVKLGLDPEQLGEVLMNASGSSYAAKTLIPEILKGNFEHGFTMQGAYKDMKQMADIASREEVPLPTFQGTMQTYQLALQKGYGSEYKGAMIHFYENLMNVRVRKEGFREDSEEEK